MKLYIILKSYVSRLGAAAPHHTSRRVHMMCQPDGHVLELRDLDENSSLELSGPAPSQAQAIARKCTEWRNKLGEWKPAPNSTILY